MKKVMFLLIGAFLLLSWNSQASKLAGNSNENELKSESAGSAISHRFSSGYYIPLTCDGENVTDILEGVVDVHCNMFMIDGNWQWMIMTFTGTLTSQSTGEVFKIKETDKVMDSDYNFTFHANVKGNMGSHYILSGSGNWESLTFDKAVCPGNSKD